MSQLDNVRKVERNFLMYLGASNKCLIEHIWFVWLGMLYDIIEHINGMIEYTNDMTEDVNDMIEYAYDIIKHT